MALTLLANNNAQTVLAAGINATATTLTVNTGTGNLFPSPITGASFFKLTLVDSATGSLSEIVHVTSRTGDTMTIEREKEGTTARIWSANDIAANMLTAGSLQLYAQKDQSLLIGNNLSEIANAGPAAVAKALSNLGLANGSGYVGRLLGVRVITTSGTYTPTAGTKSIVVEVQGGGGGGGGGAISGTGASAGGGGTSGCYAKSFLTTLNSSYPVTIGAGGNGAAGNQVGGGGGKTSFGTVVTADGGYGGDTMGSTGSTPMIVSASSGSQPSLPVATGGNIININIQQQPTQAFRLSAVIGCSGCGGASLFGQGGGNGSTSNTGAPSPSYGGGGGGGIAIGSSAASFSGGNGGSGVIMVWEYA